MRYREIVRVGLVGLALLAVPSLVAAQNLDFAKVTDFHAFVEEFDNYESDQWIVTTTEAGAGDATEAVADADGGILLITNDAADDDRDFFQYSGDDDSGTVETFTYTAGKRLYCESRFKVSDATQSDFVFGLQVTDTTPLAVADGIWFQKDDGDANLDFHVANSSTQTNGTAVATVSNDTYMTLAFYYDGGDGGFKLYKDGAAIGTVAKTNAPSTELTISFGIQNGEAVAKSMSVDYVACFKERDRVSE